MFVTLSVCLSAVCLSVCPEEWYKKQNNGIYYKKRAEREASPLRSSTKNRIMGYTIYYYKKREERGERSTYTILHRVCRMSRSDETSEERARNEAINTSNKRRERGAERRGKIEL